MRDLHLALLDLKELINQNQHIDFGEIGGRYGIEPKKLKPYAELLKRQKRLDESYRMSYNNQPIWTDEERYLVSLYMSDMEKIKNKTKALQELTKVMDRSNSSVEFHYYNHVRNKIEAEEVLNELYGGKEEQEMNKQEEKQEPEKKKDNEDVIDYIQTLFQCVEKLPNLDIDSMLKGLSVLAKAAIQNNMDPKELEEAKEKMERLEEENHRLKERLKEVKDLISYFESLDAAQKISQLKSYNQKLKEEVEKVEIKEKEKEENNKGIILM